MTCLYPCAGNTSFGECPVLLSLLCCHQQGISESVPPETQLSCLGLVLDLPVFWQETKSGKTEELSEDGS